jgi:micrococcal nuclease
MRVMRRLLALAVLAAVAVLLAWPRGGGDDRSARVVRAVDGDTIRVSVGGREQSVRLLGIDTPETHRPGTPIECGGPEASAAMERLVPAGTRVMLEPDPTQDRVDRYGRLLAYVRLPSGRLAEEELLRAGWASTYVYGGRPVSRLAAFRSWAASARAGRRGVWRLCGGDFHSG